MSIEDKKQIAELERKVKYYKEMYEMRTEAYIREHRAHEVTRYNLQMVLRQETIYEIMEHAMEK